MVYHEYYFGVAHSRDKVFAAGAEGGGTVNAYFSLAE
jgi:hypothetical protein